MDNTSPNWYCPQCNTQYEERKKYCSQCTAHPMLRFLCTATGEDDLYSHFMDRHISHCRTCTQYHNLLDIISTQQTLEENEQLHYPPLPMVYHTHSHFQLFVLLIVPIDSNQSCTNICLYITVLCCVIVHTMTAKWLSTPKLLQYKVGLNVEELNTIWGYIRDPLIQHYLNKHLFQPSIYPYESIVVTLYWLRLYAPKQVIAAELDVSYTAIRECIQHVLDSLSSHFTPHYVSSDNAPNQRTRIVGDQYCYGAVDSTFICIDEPEQRADRGTYFHIKSGTKYAIKLQLAIKCV
jgi:hypothetical protein